MPVNTPVEPLPVLMVAAVPVLVALAVLLTTVPLAPLVRISTINWSLDTMRPVVPSAFCRLRVGGWVLVKVQRILAAGAVAAASNRTERAGMPLTTPEVRFDVAVPPEPMPVHVMSVNNTPVGGVASLISVCILAAASVCWVPATFMPFDVVLIV